uniref:Uncharacterized protein n=1 Tax=Euplotes crassus TaxID=5936 RepID=A0A7S3KWA0_EUPCR|mmetsp:Transcript_7708/g.7256  ORF Transcript_7708/g.7256 Transcript_7708/m.7256 type:complete len:128 (+) Transcript_7708:177-560(+)
MMVYVEVIWKRVYLGIFLILQSITKFLVLVLWCFHIYLYFHKISTYDFIISHRKSKSRVSDVHKEPSQHQPISVKHTEMSKSMHKSFPEASANDSEREKRPEIFENRNSREEDRKEFERSSESLKQI